MLSSNAVKKLGKRLRDGFVTPEELDMLDVYRAEFEPLLLETCGKIGIALDSKLKYIVAGRMKRTKSIIRKLARDHNSGMDLSRMSDLVGLRVIVADIADQDSAITQLTAGLTLVRDPYDYRDRNAGYRAVHLVVGDSAHRVEIQIRTLAQHLWADESERMGEHVKEGTMSPDEEEHLSDLYAFCRDQDYVTQLSKLSSNFFLVWQSTLDQQRARYNNVTAQQLRRLSRSYVVVYHQATNALLRVEAFSHSERSEALDFFKSVSRTYDGPDYDVLVLNSPSQDALVVTHPRYFPEGVGQARC